MDKETRARFLARWIPFGIHLANRAEALGVDWDCCSMEELTSRIILAEEFATPDEYKTTNRKAYHG